MSDVWADRSKVTRLVSIVQGGGMAEFRRQKCGSGETRRMSPVWEAHCQPVGQSNLTFSRWCTWQRTGTVLHHQGDGSVWKRWVDLCGRSFTAAPGRQRKFNLRHVVGNPRGCACRGAGTRIDSGILNRSDSQSALGL